MKIFCKHKYEYYYKDRYTPLLSINYFDKYHYLCKKCGKKSALYESDINEIVKELKEKVAYEKFTHSDNGEYDIFKFQIGDKPYQGKHAYYLKKRLKVYANVD